jgi:hypothetical protein
MPVTEVRWPEEAEELEANRKAHTEFACCKWAWNMHAAAANPWEPDEWIQQKINVQAADDHRPTYCILLLATKLMMEINLLDSQFGM